MNAEKHQIEKIKEFERQQQLGKNALYQWAENLLENVRSGKVFTTRVFGILLAVILVTVLVVFLVRGGKSDKSRVWSDFAAATSGKALREFVEQNPKSPAALPARVQLARIQLGPEGMHVLNVKLQRSKAIENVEKGRDEMVKLAEEAKNDLALKVECLKAAGEAELSLVGIPTSAAGSQFRGTVEKAAEYFKQAALAAGPSTPDGEASTRKAADILANKKLIEDLGWQLNNQLSASVALPPISPADLTPGRTKPDLPALPDLGPAPPPAAAVAGGAAVVDPGKKDEKKDDKREVAPAPKPGEKK